MSKRLRVVPFPTRQVDPLDEHARTLFAQLPHNYKQVYIDLLAGTVRGLGR